MIRSIILSCGMYSECVPGSNHHKLLCVYYYAGMSGMYIIQYNVEYSLRSGNRLNYMAALKTVYISEPLQEGDYLWNAVYFLAAAVIFQNLLSLDLDFGMIILAFIPHDLCAGSY